jgi:hypothetical protein
MCLLWRNLPILMSLFQSFSFITQKSVEAVFFFLLLLFFFFFWFLPHFNLHKICQMQTVDMFPKKALEALKDIR